MPISFKKLVMGGGSGGGISVGKIPSDLGTPTPTSSPPPTPSYTTTPVPTSTPSATPAPTPTGTPSPSPTATPLPSGTEPTPTPTATSSGGALWVWGNNSLDGSLGIGLYPPEFDFASEPVQTWYGGQNWVKSRKTYKGLYAEKDDGTIWYSGEKTLYQEGGNPSQPLGRISIAQQIPFGPWNPLDWDVSTPDGSAFYIIKSDGTLWVFGNNWGGKLGTNDTAKRSSPVQIGTSNTWSKIVSNYYNAYAIKQDGTLWAWGQNSYGSVGNDTIGYDISSPVQIGTENTWTNIYTNQYNPHVVGQKSDNSLWEWGKIQHTINNGNLSSPTLLVSDKSWITFCADGSNIFGITSDNKLWGAGVNYNKQVADTGIIYYSSLVQVHADMDFKHVAVATNMVSAIDTNNRRWIWGYNYTWLGAGNTGSPLTVSSSPVQTDNYTTWLTLDMRSNASSASGIRTDLAPTPIPTNTPSPTPSPSPTPTATPPATPSTTSAFAYSFGIGGSNLGRNTNVATWLPADLLFASEGVTDMINTFTSGAGMIVDGKLFTWGSNSQGLLGTSTSPTITPGRSSPVQVGSDNTWSQIEVSNFAMAIKTDGTLWTWGSNAFGQLGINSITHRSSPVQVGAETSWSKAVAVTDAAFAIKTDGTLWSWGTGSSGIGGRNSTVNFSSPIQIGTGTDWSLIAGSASHMLALKTNGTIWSWGQNSNGQGGYSNTRSSPVQFWAATDWNKIFASANISFALKTDGTLWGWGANTSAGRYLGVPSLSGTAYSSPVQILGNTWTDVATNTSGSMALKSDGTLWSWGDRTLRCDTAGVNVIYSSPVQVGFLDNKWIGLGRVNNAGFAIYKRTT